MGEVKWQHEVFMKRLKAEFDFYNKDSRIYWYGNGMVPVGHKKRNDLVVFHDLTKLPSPMAIELKTADSFDGITEGLINQVKGDYQNRQFTVEKENWIAKPFPFWCFSTIPAIQYGLIYSKHYPEAANFFIERFAWKCKIGIIKRDQHDIQRLEISYRNARYAFNDRLTQVYSWSD